MDQLLFGFVKLFRVNQQQLATALNSTELDMWIQFILVQYYLSSSSFLVTFS